MLGFEWWWALLLLPLPLLVGRLLATSVNTQLALAVPMLSRQPYEESLISQSSSRMRRLCLWAFWICLIIAACRPFWLGDPISRTVSGRDLMLAVDISGSMSETDMTISSKPASRIDVLKLVVGQFIERRHGDRIGLILFGTNAYTYVPLTFDLDALGDLLVDISTGLAGRHTAIGDALGLAVKSMRKQESRHKVLILVTDGSNTAGFENPIVAAQVAAQQGLTIHTIGIGTDAEALAQIYGAQNIPTGLVLNERLLANIAEVSGGQYFHATNLAALEQIYFELDKLEPVDYEYQSHRPRHELYLAPLSAGLQVMLLHLLARLWQSRASRQP
ncbi:MAG: VWA domain-containing protein [Gammaproteobacteria bacterium]|nr:VWA domain-containing protein [Gammaproteobacteria bacterium]